MSAEHWQSRYDVDEYTAPIAELVHRLPEIVWQMRLWHAGDTNKETAAVRVLDIIDRVLSAAWDDE